MKQTVEAETVEPHPEVLAAIIAAVTAGACAEAERVSPGLYSYVGEAHRRAARAHLRRFAEERVHDGGKL